MFLNELEALLQQLDHLHVVLGGERFELSAKFPRHFEVQGRQRFLILIPNRDVSHGECGTRLFRYRNFSHRPHGPSFSRPKQFGTFDPTNVSVITYLKETKERNQEFVI
jgi:hypothetical protein